MVLLQTTQPIERPPIVAQHPILGREEELAAIARFIEHRGGLGTD